LKTKQKNNGTNAVTYFISYEILEVLEKIETKNSLLSPERSATITERHTKTTDRSAKNTDYIRHVNRLFRCRYTIPFTAN